MRRFGKPPLLVLEFMTCHSSERRSVFLLQSSFLLALGLLALVAYAYLAMRYCFKVPFRGILVATAFYVSALVIIHLMPG